MKTRNIYRALMWATIVVLASFTPVRAADDISEAPEIQYTSSHAPELYAKAAELATPVKIYEYLRNNTEYALYHGSRSGSINSFLGLRGNDVDLASVLIAMYRSRGIHARYAVGTVRVAADQIKNWLGVTNFDLAVSIMEDMGIQNVAAATDKTYVDFEHVWVEAQIPYGNYRGAGSDAASTTCNASSDCHWVALDPSFKQKAYNNPIDIYSALSFDYTSYYNAIKNNDSSRMNKNPQEIYEEQILTYLQTNHPGKTLEDVAYTGNIIAQDSLILPASLPYTVIGTPRRYNSVADHDAVVPGTEPVKWGKTLNLIFTMSQLGYEYSEIGDEALLLSALATKRLVLATEITSTGPRMVLRLGGTQVSIPLPAAAINGHTPALGDAFTISVGAEASPALPSEANCPTAFGSNGFVCVAYSGVVGGNYLIATGGDTSNWSQVHRAAQQLLDVNAAYKIVLNQAEPGCDTATGLSCTPYIDTNSNGIYDTGDQKLLENAQAMDDLTGGLLYVAAMQYYTKLREGMQRLDALNHIKSPLCGFLGVVSSTYEVEYVDGTAFSVLPGGLLIDMKGIRTGGSWRVNQPETISDSQLLFAAHIVSSLEHEVWQELTGYDAISTVRGIQMALAAGASLVNPKKNATADTLPGLYASLGFDGSVPSGFTYAPMSIFSTAPATWSHPMTGSEFDTFKSTVNLNTPAIRRLWAEYVYSPTAGLYGWSSCVSNLVSQINSLQAQGYTSFSGQTCDDTPFSGSYSSVMSLIQNDYLNTIIPIHIGQDFFNYFDRNQGFVPTDHVYHDTYYNPGAYDKAYVMTIRNDLYLHDLNSYWVEYLLPTARVAAGSNYFSVHIRKAYDTSSSNLAYVTVAIENNGPIPGSQPTLDCNWSRTDGDGDSETTIAVDSNFASAVKDLVTNCQISGNCDDTRFTICSGTTASLVAVLDADYTNNNEFATYGYFFAGDTTAQAYNGYTGAGTAYQYAKGIPVFAAKYNPSGLHAVGHLINGQSNANRSANITTSVSGYTINTADSQYIAVTDSTVPYGAKAHTLINTMMGTSLPGTIPSYVHSPLYGNIGLAYNSVIDNTNKSGFVAKSQLCSISGGVNTNEYVYVEFTNPMYTVNQYAIKLNSSAAATALDNYIKTTLGCPSGNDWTTFLTDHCYGAP